MFVLRVCAVVFPDVAAAAKSKSRGVTEHDATTVMDAVVLTVWDKIIIDSKG